jgi:adenosylhomocysteinase
MTQNYRVADIGLAEKGKLQIEWAEARMPVLMELRRQLAEDKPLAGQRIAGCLHVTKETAVLIRTLVAAGAEVAWSGCNPLSTNDEIAAALASDGVAIYAWHGLNRDDYYWCIDKTLEIQPTLTLDDGADLITRVHTTHQHLVPGILGGTEETTTGVHRLRSMAAADKLLYPVLAVNDAETKWDFDNVYGTGQSTLDGILRATSILLAGKKVVVAGYGHCGKGVASRAKGLGSTVGVTEIKATAALKAVMEGHTVAPMNHMAAWGDVFITATGVKDVIVGRHFDVMRDGAIVCNTGHYDCEINIGDLTARATSKRTIRDNCDEYTMADGRRIYLLGDGRLVNLACAEGHPSEVMDMSFANQAMGMVLMAREGRNLRPGVYDPPPALDQQIAATKLSTMGLGIDTLTAEQVEYSNSYLEGT